MEIFVDRRSTNCLKVIAVAKHVAAAVNFIDIDLSRGEQRSPGVLAMNPMGQVPILRDGTRILTESNAIIQYLAELSQDYTLWPRSAWARADVSRWLFWSAAQLGPAVKPFQWERMFKSFLGLGPADPNVIARAEIEFPKVLNTLEIALAGAGEGIAGASSPTLADYALAATLFYAEPAGLPLAKFPRVSTWRDQMMELPAWRAAPEAK